MTYLSRHIFGYLALILLSLTALADTTTVLQAGIEPAIIPPGSALKITYNWDAVPMNADYKVFVHVRDSSNTLKLQADHNPPFPTKTSTWSGVTNWTRNLTIPTSMANGTYKIIIGLYNSTNGNQSLLAGPGVFSFLGTTTHFQVGTFTVDHTAPPPPLDSDGPVTLDLSNYHLTFSEEFNGPLDISNWGPGTKWIAHTPYGGDFGDAWFTSPTNNPSPFSVANGILDITAWWDASASHWRSGLISSVDTNGNGFAQQYGYFEMRAKFPEGPGTWPAFWLLSQNSVTETNPTTYEVDIVEQYGHDPQTMHSVVHTWYASGVHTAVADSFHVEDMSAGFHTYGCMITETDMVWYFDGVELWRQSTPDEAKVPFYIMVNLALGAGFPTTNTPNPSVMEVDYVRAYAENDALMEVGEVSWIQDSGWKTVNLASTFSNPIVVMSPVSVLGADPAHARVRNVTSNSFEFTVEEWEYRDGIHSADETLFYMVAEEGVHTIGGLKLQAGQAQVNQNWQTIPLTASFGSAPVILPQITTTNDPIAANLRVKSVTSSSFQVHVDEEENENVFHAYETVHFVALSEGSGDEGGAALKVSRTGQNVTDSLSTVSFGETLNNPAFFAHIQTVGGGDTTAIRFFNLSNAT